ncbi:MAG: isoprenylcysteine carboxylmethyltransferase family protein [Gemmatimonadota bacterium]
MRLSLRKIRLRLVWLLILPFLWFAAPTPALLATGAAVALVGLAIRAWAAGYIHKEMELATDGPYAHVRNPLYVGSLLVGLGVTVAGGQWVFVVAFLLFYVTVYGRTARGEAELLSAKFGEHYRAYAARVPLFWPRLTPAAVPGPQPRPRFTVRRYWKNREYEAALGLLAGFLFLAAKLLWWPR